LPSLFILSQRLSVVREMQKDAQGWRRSQRAPSLLLGIPRSTVATALILRSFE
jgi:hypothetical protein